jgi:uncharacterized iron-regulated membrane protein
MPPLGWVALALGTLLLAAIGAGFYLYSTREQESPWITPRREYNTDAIIGLVGGFLA